MIHTLFHGHWHRFRNIKAHYAGISVIITFKHLNKTLFIRNESIVPRTPSGVRKVCTQLIELTNANHEFL